MMIPFEGSDKTYFWIKLYHVPAYILDISRNPFRADLISDLLQGTIC